jgi:hypothetical protein
MAEAVLHDIASAIIVRFPLGDARARCAVSVPANGKTHILGGGVPMDVSTDDMGPSEGDSGSWKETTNYQGMSTCE